MRVQAAAYRLIQTGELEPTRRYSKEQARERAEKIAHSREFGEEVKELAKQGLTSIQIAERLEDSVRRVHFIMWRMNKKGILKLAPEQLRSGDRIGYVDKYASTPTGELYDKVAQMRNEGKSNGEIAEALGLGKHKVETLASNLIRAGVIKPALKGRRREREVGVVDPNAEVQRGRNYDGVAELRKHGLNNQQIAEKLNITYCRVTQIASELILAGIIEPMKRGRAKGTTFERTTTIQTQVAKLRNEGFGNTEIAEKLGVPRERINAIAHKLISKGQIQPLKADRRTETFKIDSVNSQEAYERRKPYREVISGLIDDQIIEVVPNQDESLQQIYYDVNEAVKDVGKKVKISRTINGTLLIELKNKKSVLI